MILETRSKQGRFPAWMMVAVLVSFTAVLGAGPLVGQLAGSPTDDAQRFVVPLSDPANPARVRVNLVFGSITVEAYSGREVVVEARGRAGKSSSSSSSSSRGRGSDSASTSGPTAGMRRIPNDSIGLVVEERGNRVDVSSESWNRAVDIRVLAPASASLELTSVNSGDLVVSGIEGDLELSNTNGSIQVQGAAGTVVAATTNGQVKVTFARLTGDRPMAFSTFNGAVDVTFPANLAADFELRSDNGEIFSDFDMTMLPGSTRAEPKRSGGRYRVEIDRAVRGRVGAGGREIRMQTFNGNILVRRAGS